MFSYMKVYCPICKAEMNGMKAYGRDSHTCGKECHDEWEWRRTLAIMGKPWTPMKGSRWDDSAPVASLSADTDDGRSSNVHI